MSGTSCPISNMILFTPTVSRLATTPPTLRAAQVVSVFVSARVLNVAESLIGASIWAFPIHTNAENSM